MKGISLILLTLLFSFFDSDTFAFVSTASPEQPYKIKTVVLDAGHGGHDIGCKGSSNHEKNIALAITLKLGKYIEENFSDVKVIYTRKTDVFIELNERAAIANRNKADLFISIHCNANHNKSAYGTETFVMGLHRSESNLDVAKRENSVILYEDNYEEKYSYNPNAPASHILFSLYTNAFLDQSISLATKIEDEFSNRAKRNSRGVKQAGFLVLYKTAMPSVLVESGFLTNKNEEEYLESEKGQDYIASAIYRAFKRYKEEMEGDFKMIVEDKHSEPVKSEKSNVLLASTDPVPTDKKPADKPAETPSTDAGKIEFRIQFLATNKAIDEKKAPYANLRDIHSETLPNGTIRYFSGRYYTPAEAKAALKWVKDKGFKDAFLTAYQHGKQININTALASF